MLTELGGKGGRICQSARDGQLRCPLIVRPNSEDAVTGNLFGALEAINPRHWLPQLLNRGLGADRFRTQVFRQLKIELWQRQPVMPKHLVPWPEGATEVDVVVTWENPPTTVFIEMKYQSDLALTSSRHDGTNGFPADQLIRNLRVGLYRCGWYDEPRLFAKGKRDFVVLLMTPTGNHPLVGRYRNPATFRKSLPHGDLLTSLPRRPFVGHVTYADLIELLETRHRFLTWNERVLVERLTRYLAMKLNEIPAVRNDAGNVFGKSGGWEAGPGRERDQTILFPTVPEET